MRNIVRAGALLGLAASLPAAVGFYSVSESIRGHWDLLDPQGHSTFSTGVCVVQPFDSAIPAGGSGYGMDRRSPEAIEAWARDTAQRLRAWNFNTVGAWSDPSMAKQGLAYTVSLALLGYDRPEDRLIDLWDPARVLAMQQEAQKGAAGRKDDPFLLGYFLDNELPWYGSTGWPGPQNTPLLDKYLALPARAPGRAAAVAAVKEHYHGDLGALPLRNKQPWSSWDELANAPLQRDNPAWPESLRDEFAGVVARRYFELAVKAVKDSDPNHLVLGCRFAGATPDAVVAASKVCDVVSVNSYQKSGRFDQDLFDTVYLLTHRPILLTEFGYRAMENRSGNRNTRGADVTVKTQADRATHLDRFLGGALELPYLVGYHWFQYFDEPTPGRGFDGEDSNYGLVDVGDRPYREITSAFTRWNQNAAALHAMAAHVIPAEIPRPAAIKVRRRLGERAGAGANAGEASLGDFGGNAALSWVWKEAGAKAWARPEAGLLRFDYDSGDSWGCGLGLKTVGANKDASLDLLDSSGVRLTLRAPRGLRFQVFVNESGIGDPGQDRFPGAGGADGESYQSPVLVGTGEDRQTVTVPWDRLEIRASWGNQHGNRTVDLQAIVGLDLALTGTQGAGTVWVEQVDRIP